MSNLCNPVSLFFSFTHSHLIIVLSVFVLIFFLLPASLWHSNPSYPLSLGCIAPLQSLLALAHLTPFRLLSYFLPSLFVFHPLLFLLFSCFWGILAYWGMDQPVSLYRDNPEPGAAPTSSLTSGYMSEIQLRFQAVSPEQSCEPDTVLILSGNEVFNPELLKKSGQNVEQRVICTYTDTFRPWVTLWPSWALQKRKDSGEVDLLSQYGQAQWFHMVRES